MNDSNNYLIIVSEIIQISAATSASLCQSPENNCKWGEAGALSYSLPKEVKRAPAPYLPLLLHGLECIELKTRPGIMNCKATPQAAEYEMGCVGFRTRAHSLRPLHGGSLPQMRGRPDLSDLGILSRADSYSADWSRPSARDRGPSVTPSAVGRCHLKESDGSLS